MFVVIDTIDGGGSETQGNAVAAKLQADGIKTTLLKYPNYEKPAGNIIKQFLYENKDLTVEKQFLLYTLQFIFDAKEITEASQEGVVIADRYFTTTLVFQTLEGFAEEKALQFSTDFGIIRPDFVYFLNVTPETAFKWKHGEDKELNFRETDLDFIKKTYTKYTDLANRNVFAPWVTIDGERSKEEVTDSIVSDIKSKL